MEKTGHYFDSDRFGHNVSRVWLQPMAEAMLMQTGLDRLVRDESLLAHLRGVRVGLLANPASMTSIQLGFEHALDALGTKLGKAVTAAFGPQHGMRGDKQYNMEESPTYLDPQYGIPVFSLSAAT